MLPPGFLDRPFAHRGLHGGAAVENSLSAVRAAVAAGYGIEIDIQPSADGVPMVFHDYDMGRLTGRPGPLRGLSARQLGETPLTGGAGDTVPTLAQVLEAVAGAVPLLIEIKDQDGALGPGVGPLEDAVCGALAGYDGPVALMSFQPACGGRLRRRRAADPARPDHLRLHGRGLADRAAGPARCAARDPRPGPDRGQFRQP